ncbi:ParB/RepB/Spo0J family partition protein [Litorimonas sp. RW-G-Af-16]|uniref:ParB/RepB/Spo0J family partition protein n=1 Tax=Litorimonas sp. RW-G-Af-16 TaxID=3241168 RepID=UPI00390CD483
MSYLHKHSQFAAATAAASIKTAPIEVFAAIRSKILFGQMLQDVKAVQRSIAKLGLLSPLVVVERAGKLYVIDGQKRLAAIRRLRFTGQLPRSLNRIPYVLYADTVERQSPAPALLSNRELYEGVVEAFKAGASPDAIAKELYLTRQNVTQILTLSRLSPRLRGYFFDGHLNLEQAKAYAATPHHVTQDRVFDALGPFAGDREILAASKDVAEQTVVAMTPLELKHAA